MYCAYSFPLRTFFGERSEHEDLRLSTAPFTASALRLYINGWLSETPNKLYELPGSFKALFGLCVAVKTGFKLPQSFSVWVSFTYSVICLSCFFRSFKSSANTFVCKDGVFKLSFSILLEPLVSLYTSYLLSLISSLAAILPPEGALSSSSELILTR